MKKHMVVIFILFYPITNLAVGTCDNYITDQWPDSRYIIENIADEKIVSDTKTKLIWKQCSEGLHGVDCTSGILGRYSWQQALELPQILNIKGYAGYSDWRLPNIKELRSLVAGNCFNPSINETVFPNTASHNFWSSSPLTGAGAGDVITWIVGFLRGRETGDFRDHLNRVRLVRGN